MEALEQAWNAFAAQLREEGKVGLATTVAAAKLTCTGTNVAAEWANEVQIAQMADIRTTLCGHLRATLRNGAIELEARVRPDDARERAIFLNDRDRYDALVAANPAVDELRRRLDLDFA